MTEQLDSGRRGVVVTGSTGRLARVLIPRLEAADYLVIPIHGPHRNALAPSADGMRYRGDLTIPSEVERCFADIDRDHGAIYALIHAVGAWQATPLETTPPEEWDALVRTNLFSTYLCFREAAKYMRGSGRLIAFSAGQGANQGARDQSAYGAAKAGVIRLVESAAAELADRSVTAHVIAPSFIVYGNEALQQGVRAEDLADLCLHVLSSAGRALNGQLLRAFG